MTTFDTTNHEYRLTDRYRVERGTAFMSGIQALARLPIEQLTADQRAGLRTAAFVSGYPGSPLGGFDGAMRSAASLRPELEIVHRPGLNEEYAATAVMGSQLAAARPERRFDGVVGIWYGKAPGVDRAVDALRHGGYAGTNRHSGVVALVGDDPVAKSSSVPSSSAGILADLHMPLLYPGDPAEALDLGRHAVALSRASGLWAALKIVADVADGTASVRLDVDRVRPVIPRLDGKYYDHTPDGRLLTPRTLDTEREIYEIRYPLAIEYARLNRLNAVTAGRNDARVGILASGITYREVREALDRMGLHDDREIADAGLRLFRMQMPIPFNPASVREFAAGLDEIIVVEEKAPNLEILIKDALYGLPDRPLVVGKIDDRGEPLFAGFGGLDADAIGPGLRRRLESRIGDRLAPPPPPRRETIPLTVQRSPFYCSGCPHNRSTEVPDGTLVGAGIGCHTMTMLMDPDRVGEIAGLTPMGNEGTQWIGMSPFVDREHFVQNLGDGTYFHSGQLAITAAVAAGVDITYKLLYNGAIAMTGGQDPQGQLSVGAVARILLEQGVTRVVVTSDDPDGYPRGTFPEGVDVLPRDRIVDVQRELAAVSGVTVLIHDQACAAEARRYRKRGEIPMPTRRIVINHRVCEGCGDCGQVSNCLSVQPVQTPFGRKTRIDQTTCNFDESCLGGDCPSFMVVETDPSWWSRLIARIFDRRTPTPLTAKRADDGADIELPEPEIVVPSDDLAIRITGIGGTGVVTVAQTLGTAAMLDGFDVRGLDQIGLSQKAGPVVSDLRIRRGASSNTNRLGAEQADLLLALDQLVAAGPRGLTAATDTTVVVGSTSQTPTGSMITHPEIAPVPPDELASRIAAATDAGQQHWVDALAVTNAAFGNAVTANILVLGVAYQAGALPVGSERIEDAIRLNGAAVEANLAAFRLGRRLVLEPGLELTAERPGLDGGVDHELLGSLADRTGAHTPEISRLANDLAGYQDRAYARRFVDMIARVAATDPDGQLTITAARGLHRVMAYKDEYEVARLMLDDEATAEATALAGANGVVAAQLHPPALRALGLRRKIDVGPAWRPLLALLRHGKRLRGTLLDPFARAQVRREERRLVDEYISLLDQLVGLADSVDHERRIEIAGLVDHVRGYEDLKLARIDEYRSAVKSALAGVR